MVQDGGEKGRGLSLVEPVYCTCCGRGVRMRCIAVSVARGGWGRLYENGVRGEKLMELHPLLSQPSLIPWPGLEGQVWKA